MPRGNNQKQTRGAEPGALRVLTTVLWALALLLLGGHAQAALAKAGIDRADPPEAAPLAPAVADDFVPDETDDSVSGNNDDADRGDAAGDDADSDRARRRVRAGMCGSEAQSVDAPPPIYGGTGGSVSGCDQRDLRFETSDGRLPNEQVSTPIDGGKPVAVVDSGRCLPRASAVVCPVPERDRLTAEQHRGRLDRPPRS